MKKTFEERLNSGFVRTKSLWTSKQSPVTEPTDLVTISADSGLKNPCGEAGADMPPLAKGMKMRLFLPLEANAQKRKDRASSSDATPEEKKLYRKRRRSIKNSSLI